MILKAQELWNKDMFYEAHEVIEDIWRLFPKDDLFNRNCYQGLIRLAIAYNHYKNERLQSSLRVLKMAYQQISNCGENFRGIDLCSLMNHVKDHIECIEKGKRIEEFPKLLLKMR